jgi:hypothetical protein
VCQGFFAIVPFLQLFFVRLLPFVPYIIISLLVFGGFFVWQVVKQGGTKLILRVKPWHIGGVFLLCLWFLGIGFTFTTLDQMPFRQLVEPTATVYRDTPQNALQALQVSFKHLQEKGCLTEIGQVAADTKVYNVKGLCFQQFFVSRVLSQAGVAGIFLFELLILGAALFSLLRLPRMKLLYEGLISAGLGIFGWVVILWSVAVFKIYDTNVGWLLVLCMPIVCYKFAWKWMKIFFTHTFEVQARPWDASVLLFWLLISYLALNFFVVVRPFPIGWDDLGSYLNRPRLLVSYGTFIPMMSSFQWEYLTSLGFLLFGYASTFGATASMMINWTEGVLATLTVFAFGQMLFGKSKGILSALVFYTLPLIGHFSFADMKIDNAVFAMGSLALLVLFLIAFGEEDSDVPHNSADTSWKLWLLCGLFVGLAFSFKVTAVMVLMAMLVVVAGANFQWLGALGAVSAVLAVFVKQGVLDVSKMLDRIMGFHSPVASSVLLAALAILSITLIGLGVRRKGKTVLLTTGRSVGYIILGCAVAVLPWMLHNNILAGNVIPKLMFNAPNTFTVINASPFDKTAPGEGIPADLLLDRQNAACKSTSGSEELDRYWGTGKGIGHYLFLPWRSVMNVDNGGYYVTTVPGLLLFPLVLLLPLFWDKNRRKLRYMWAATLFLVIEWMFLANGVPWYGVGMFLGLSLMMEALVAHSPDRVTRGAAIGMVTLSLLMAFGMRMWQFDMQKNLIEYPLGKISADALEQRTIPWYGLISQQVTQRHDQFPAQPKLYRVGTFIPYFIPKNLDIIAVADNQLDLFNCINQERNPKLTLRRLQALGINSVIFDTNTSTIERDPNGSLHQKVNAFVDFLNTPGLGIQVVLADTGAGVAFVLLPTQ